ncbi:sensor histidine kinase [Patulibacter defluvii]|uniref:sensor histidine kinase n=1 Tax=Patulibacter defluvii TaxID=3095358 RepID=UPI002A766A78|nr:sensor histidine kinase [Patulibacter sp. DM4]
MATRPKRVAADEVRASDTQRDIERLRFAPQILARLGEELNPNPDQGVLELVRNAYDADAGRCVVELHDITAPGGEIRIRDWGEGLDRGAVKDGWLVLGRSGKEPTRRTRGGRLQVGQKGLGRLAALRLGTSAELRTWPRPARGSRSRREHVVSLDWASFDSAQVVEDVPVEVTTSGVAPTEPGTEIVIRELRRGWTRPEVKRLARALLLLADPFDADDSFKVELVCPEFPDLENLVAGSYFDYSRYQVTAEIDKHGKARLHLVDGFLGLDEWAEHDQIVGAAYDSEKTSDHVYETVPARFELFAFLRSAEGLHGAGTAATLDGLRAWLDTFGGVYVYHRGLRVAPYGDAGFDWLDMNLLRARSPEMRPTSSTAVGRVIVEDPQSLLTQKTDRAGFIEDELFTELRTFGRDVLEWVGNRRNDIAHEQRARDRKQGPQRRKVAEKKLDTLMDELVEDLPPREQRNALKVVETFKKAAAEDAEALRQDLLLYRTLATIGTTSAQIAHETFNPALTIMDLAQDVTEIGEEDLGEGFEEIRDPVAKIAELARRLRGYARLPRVLLAEPKRKMQVFSPERVIVDALDVFGVLFERHNVQIQTEHHSGDAKLRGPVALFDAILANLIINAVHALDDQSEKARTILVRDSVDGSQLVLEVADSGHGIVEYDTNEIWHPGTTTTTEGTGLGLTIVRDSASQLGGDVAALANGQLGGAHFTIRIPLAS